MDGLLLKAKRHCNDLSNYLFCAGKATMLELRLDRGFRMKVLDGLGRLRSPIVQNIEFYRLGWKTVQSAECFPGERYPQTTSLRNTLALDPQKVSRISLVQAPQVSASVEVETQTFAVPV